jgi:hypothetical protein
MPREREIEIVDGRPATENAWRRGFVDAWSAFTHPVTAIPLAILGALAAVISTIALGDVLGAVVSALGAPAVLALLVLAWALARAPVRQRDDARRELDEARGELARLQLELRPEEWLTPFDVEPMWYHDVDQSSAPGDSTRVLLLPVDFINQAQRPLHLDFELVGLQKLGPDRALTSSVLPYRGRSSEKFLPHSMTVEPDRRVADEMAWNGSTDSFLFEFGGGRLASDVTVRDEVDLVLRVTERATGRTFEKPVPKHR